MAASSGRKPAPPAKGELPPPPKRINIGKSVNDRVKPETKAKAVPNKKPVAKGQLANPPKEINIKSSTRGQYQGKKKK
jgi:hypothetical protein